MHKSYYVTVTKQGGLLSTSIHTHIPIDMFGFMLCLYQLCTVSVFQLIFKMLTLFPCRPEGRPEQLLTLSSGYTLSIVIMEKYEHHQTPLDFTQHTTARSSVAVLLVNCALG